MKHLIIKQPDDPISFLIDKLSTPQCKAISNLGKKIFIIGPPGYKVTPFALNVADVAYPNKFTTISVGDLLKKEVNKKQELG